jgi:hypothetical protein
MYYRTSVYEKFYVLNKNICGWRMRMGVWSVLGVTVLIINII